MSLSNERVREMVKESYSKLWRRETQCCSPPKASKCQGRVEVEEWSEQTVRNALLRELAPLKGKRILDVGCGTGETVLKIARKVGSNGRVVGIDFSSEAIARAKEKAVKAGLSSIAEFRVADAERLPFENESFDAVISECVVCLTVDKQHVLNEKVRVLKLGGRIVMHDVISEVALPDVARSDPELYCNCIGGALSKNDYIKMLKKVGLTEVKAVDFSDVATKPGGVSMRRALETQVLSAAMDFKSDEDFEDVIRFVRKGGLSYMLFIGTKPSLNRDCRRKK